MEDPTPPSREQIDALLVQTAGGERGYAPTSEPADAEEYLRTWTAPDLSNPEFTSLLSVFPTFLTHRTLPRFPAVTGKRRVHLDIEEGEYDESEGVRNEIRIGTGVLWIGTRERSGNWRGGWWERFKAWWRGLLS